MCALIQIERRLENMRLVSHNAHKKLTMCLQGNVGTDAEKRHVSDSCFYIFKCLLSTHFWIVVFFLLEKASSYGPFTIHGGWRESARRRVFYRVSLWTLCLTKPSAGSVIHTHEKTLNVAKHPWVICFFRQAVHLWLWSVKIQSGSIMIIQQYLLSQ